MELVNQRWRAVPARRRKGWAVVVALLCIVVPSAAYIRQASVAKRESETETVHSKVAASTGSSALVQHRDRVRSDNDTYRIELYLPGVTTQSRDSYKCMAVPVKAKGYVVRYEPKAEMNVVHHMLLHGCKRPYSMQPSWDCLMGQICERGESSLKFLYGWGRNAPPLNMPEGVGFAIGDRPENPAEDGIDYLVLQVHYLAIATQPDYSGLAAIVTTQPRPLKAGVLAFATGGSIPPHKERYHVLADSCYDDARTVQVFAFRVHAHALGRENTLSRISIKNAQASANEETAVLAVRKSPNLLVSRSPLLPQSFEPLEAGHGERFLLTPGTKLRMICTYDSSSRDRVTYFGSTAQDEMCNVYLMVMATEAVSHGNFHYRIGVGLGNLLPQPPIAAWQNGLTPRDAGLPEDLGQVSAVAIGWDAHVFVLVRRAISWGSFGVRNGERHVGSEPMMNSDMLVSGASLFAFHSATTFGSPAAPDTNPIGGRGLLANTLYMPHGLSFSPDGEHLWVTDVAQHVAIKVARSGEIAQVLGKYGEKGTGDKFCRPTQAVSASDGSIYVADGYCNCRIAHFSKEGDLVGEWPRAEGGGDCELRIPHSIALDECSATLAIADRENGRIVWLKLLEDGFADEPLAFLDLLRNPAIPEEMRGYPYAIKRAGGGSLFVLTWRRDNKPGGASLHRVQPSKQRDHRPRGLPRQGSGEASVTTSWSLAGVDYPHDLAIVAAIGDGAIVYVAETRPEGSKLHRFEFQGTTDTVDDDGYHEMDRDISLEQDRAAIKRRRQEEFRKISHGLG